MRRLVLIVATRPGNTRQVRSILTLSAAQFSHILEESSNTTEVAYRGDPLAEMPILQRSRVLQRTCRHALTVTFPNSTLSEASAGLRSDGRKRSRHQSEFDFCRDGRNVECKGTTMRWESSSQRWMARWQRIKFNQEVGVVHDLVLALHSPGRVDVMLHDHVSGVSRSGVRTQSQGHAIFRYAATSALCSSQACQDILQKLLQQPGACLRIATLETCGNPLSDFIHAESESSHRTLDCYRGVPLSGKTPSSRGLRLQKLAFEVDRMLYPESNLQYGFGSGDIVGVIQLQRRGQARASADWLRDGVRVELKTSKLCWTSANSCWSVRFCGVKIANAHEDSTAAYDELLLGVYSPVGFHILKHSGSFGVSTQGVRTWTDGHAIAVCGPSNEPHAPVALKAILAKFEAAGCELLTTITW